jgi:nucleotide-binding universal stress UspA family protein
MTAMMKILVPIDFEEASDVALTYGRSLAKAFGAELHVLHVMENQFLRLTFKSAAAVEAGIANRVAERLTPEDRTSLQAVTALRMSDDPSDEIIQYAVLESIDLIVMGTRGRAHSTHLLMGSVAEKVVRLAPCPVLTVHHPEREFVVSEVTERRRISA